MTKKTIKMFTVNLPILVLKEGKSFIAYSPALDLSTCGSTEKEAKKMFEEALQVFLEELTEAGTLEEVLLNLGWEKKARQNWQPPILVDYDSKKVTIPVAA